MRRLGLPAVLTGTALLAGCVAPPPAGPTVMALPPQGKSLDQFRQEDGYCRQSAAQGSGAAQTTAQAQNNAVGTALVGTALGAAAGAAIGSATGQAGAGAAIGAGSGLLIGSAMGANQAAGGGYYAQQQYDAAYTQCMYTYGNSVQSAPVGYAGPNPYPYPYPAAYPAPYGYGYPPPGVVIGVGGYYGPRWHRY